MAATKEKEKKESKGGTSAKGFRPLGDRVFVTYTEELERTAGGDLGNNDDGNEGCDDDIEQDDIKI